MRFLRQYFVALLISGTVLLVGCEGITKTSSPTSPSVVVKYTATLTVQGINAIGEKVSLGTYGYAKFNGVIVRASSLGEVVLTGLVSGTYSVEIGADAGYLSKTVSVVVTNTNTFMPVVLDSKDDWKFVDAWVVNSQGAKVTITPGVTFTAPAQVHTLWQVWMKDPTDTVISVNTLRNGTVYTTNGLYYGLTTGQGPGGSKYVEVYHKDYRPCQLTLPSFKVGNCQDTTDALQLR